MQIPPPFMVSYRITTKCNLKCKHCYSQRLRTNPKLAERVKKVMGNVERYFLCKKQ